MALFLLLATTTRAQDDYAVRFEKANAANDVKQSAAILKEWKHTRPDDPEYYLAAAQDVLNKNTRLEITQQVSPGDFVGKDPVTGQAWAIHDGTPSPAALRQAIDLLKEAISKAPSRIDIYLNLARLYEDAGDDAAVVKELSEMVAYARAHAGALHDTEGKPYPEPVDEKLSYAISGIAGRYFLHETKEANQTFLELAKLDLGSFPDCEYGYNLMGNYYCSIDQNPKLALESYEHALRFDPNDSLVWHNIGVVHMIAGDKEEAIKAFEKVVALNNDPEYLELAKKHLARLM